MTRAVSTLRNPSTGFCTPRAKKQHEQVGILDLACVLGGERDRGLIFQILAKSLILALQRNFSVDPSMPVLVQKQIGLVHMLRNLLGKFVECRSRWTRYRGILYSVNLECANQLKTLSSSSGYRNTGRSASEWHSSWTEEPVALRLR